MADDTEHQTPVRRPPPALWSKLKPRARKMRHEPTPAENALWQHLRRKQFGVNFRRQHVIGQFIVDFFCSELMLAIEIDGQSHDYKVTYDRERQNRLENLGVKFLRFDDADVKQNLDAVVFAIRDCIEKHTPPR